MNKKSDSPAEGNSETPVPGRTSGFLIMSVLIVFVAIFMQVQSQRASDPDSAMASGEPVSDRFRAAAWFLPDDALLGFVEIPAGPFTMGSNPALDRMAYENERWSSTQRQGEVQLPAFYIARFETTLAQFSQFADATGLGSADLAMQLSGEYPVTGVTWPEALSYARWLDGQLRQSPETPAPIRRFLEAGGQVNLPTEAEWEKAARTDDGRIFPWGTQPTSRFANFDSDSLRPVGAVECPPCAYGISDMAGNVWELTRSPMQDYPYNGSDDLMITGADPLFVMRGGSFRDSINNVRAAVRGAVDPGVRNDTIGFRVAITNRER